MRHAKKNENMTQTQDRKGTKGKCPWGVRVGGGRGTDDGFSRQTL